MPCSMKSSANLSIILPTTAMLLETHTYMLSVRRLRVTLRMATMDHFDISKYTITHHTRTLDTLAGGGLDELVPYGYIWQMA